MGISERVQIRLIAGGRSVSWEEAVKLAEGTMVEVACTLKGGGRNKGKRKDRNPWNSSGESTMSEATPEEHEGGQEGDQWTETVKAALKEWGRKSLENGMMRRFVDQAAQMGPEQRNEAVREYGETLQEFPNEQMKGMAVSFIRWMVDEKAEEEEQARLAELIRRKNEEGFFRKGSGPDEKFDFGKHHGRSFKEVYLWDQGYCQWAIQQKPQTKTLLSFKYFARRMGDITYMEEKAREKGGDWVVAKLRRELSNRVQETAKELGEEENRVIKNLLAGVDEEPENTEKQRWADVEESEEEGVKEVEKRKKTDWMALLEVAREKDVGNTEKGRWEVRDEGKGKTRSGTREKRGKGPSLASMVPNMGTGGSHLQTMRVPEEAGDETEKEEVRNEKEEDGEQEDGRNGKKAAGKIAVVVLKAAEEELEKAETMEEAASRNLEEVSAALVKTEGGKEKMKEVKEEEQKKEMWSENKTVVTQREFAVAEEERERVRRDRQWESLRQRELSSHGRRKAEEWGEKVGEELKAAAMKEEPGREEQEGRKGDGETWREVKEEVKGVMEYLRQMDQKLQRVSNKVEKLEEEGRRRKETSGRDVNRGGRFNSSGESSDESNGGQWELRGGSWYLRVGQRRMNSRERRRIWRKVRQLMEEEERERERGVEKWDARFDDEV